MKIFCFRYPRNKITDVLISLLCIICITLILSHADTMTEKVSGAADDYVSKFLQDNGWLTDADYHSITTKTVPYIFDKTYSEYEILQNKQGFSLKEYIGCVITVETFLLRNFPDYEGNENVYINILTYNDRIIGADIHSTSINGFITGAVRDVNYQN